MQPGESRQWIVPIALASLAGTAACLGGGAASVSSTSIPVTPPITLPPVWTPSPAPALNIPAGWRPFTGTGVELWLPESFEGGDPATRRNELPDLIRSLGPDYQNMVSALENGAPGMVFLAFDQGPVGAMVGVTRRDLPATVRVEEYLEAYLTELPNAAPGLVVLEHGTLPLQGEQVGKAIVEVSTQGAKSVQVSYLFHRGDALYTLSYSAPSEAFVEAEPAFEASIASFRLTQ
jgi:hypothetical protein